MATLLYLLRWWALRPYDTFPYDWPILCLLLALDTSTAVRLWIWRRSGR